MKNISLSIFALVLIILALAAGKFYYDNLRGAAPALLPPNDELKGAVNETNLPLTIPDGFKISIFAGSLPGARVLTLGPNGMFVSQTGQGKITFLQTESGAEKSRATLLSGLDNPHGLVLDDGDLYYAEEGKISRINLESKKTTELADLPTGGGHFTRTLGLGPDDRLYVSIGSSCNVCNEKDDRRAKIFSLNKDGSDFKEFARGLRNTVFFAWSYIDGKMWGTDMGRDLLGDDTPPDEINILKEDGNYGWPICYGKQTHDTNFDKNIYVRDPCADTVPSQVDLQAHSAPLGLAFVPEEGWPEEYWYDLLVAFHGSWNRTIPTGYKVVRIKLDERGNYQGVEDFITGWAGSGRQVLGRPVDILIQPGGTLYISDDKAGVIYKMQRL